MQIALFAVFLLFTLAVPLSRGHSISVKALSHHPNSPATADAPSPAAPASNSSSPAAPQPNLIALMSKKGCKTFADLLKTGDAAKSFEDSVDGGLTVFCPNDEAMKGFLPKLKNLTADEKASLLLYHGVPVYYSLDSLKSSNGVMNTLATDGVDKNYNFTVQNNGDVVTLRTAGPTASIKTTVVDMDPLAVYSIDEVLEPLELFKPAEVPAPSPAPAADAPVAAKGKKKKHAASPPAPEGPDAQPADQKAADENAGWRACAWWWAVAATAVAVVVVA